MKDYEYLLMSNLKVKDLCGRWARAKTRQQCLVLARDLYKDAMRLRGIGAVIMAQDATMLSNLILERGISL